MVRDQATFFAVTCASSIPDESTIPFAIECGLRLQLLATANSIIERRAVNPWSINRPQSCEERHLPYILLF
jgi:hypothetical protein